MHLNIDAKPEDYGLPKKADGYAVYNDEWYAFETLQEAIDEYISESIDLWDLKDGVEVILMSTTLTDKPWEEGDFTHVPNKKVKVRLSVTAEVLEEIKISTDRSHDICQDCPIKDINPPKCDCQPSEHYCQYKSTYDE